MAFGDRDFSSHHTEKTATHRTVFASSEKLHSANSSHRGDGFFLFIHTLRAIVFPQQLRVTGYELK